MKSNTITFRTGSWFADEEKTFPLPAGWDTTTYRMPEMPALGIAEIRDTLVNPVGTGPIAREAKGAKDACIIVDDLSRPTPVAPVCLAVMDELNAAGIPDEKIRLLVGGGAHRPLNKKEIRMKVGAAMDRAGVAVAHDAYYSPVTHFGQTKRHTPVLVNNLACTDFTIAVSGIYPLQVAGFGGGNKMIMPAISHISSILWNHTRLGTGTRVGALADSERRLDIEEYGKIFGLNMIVNAVLNDKREICGLVCGDPVKAHRKGVSFARKAYDSGLTDGKTYDLTIANAYPLDADSHQLCKSSWAYEQFNTPLLIVSEFQDPYIYHGQADGPFRVFKKNMQPGSMPPQSTKQLMDAKIIVYNPNYGTKVFPNHSHWYYENDWNRLMRGLKKRWPQARVRVMPTASMQY